MTTTLISIRDGTITIPDELCERYGLEDGSLITIEASPDGIVLRSADLPEIEVYTPERIAEFLLSNAVGDEDYRRAAEEVKELGIDPAEITPDR